MGALGLLLAGDAGAGVIGLAGLPVTATGLVLLWIAVLLTLITGWQYLTVGMRHAMPARPVQLPGQSSGPAGGDARS
jgi:cardiolipin synthase